MVGQGKGSFGDDEDGNPIEFTGCQMEISRDEWLQRARTDEADPAP